ncbi:sugar phosphate isomerase/epimerase [bacterium]|nr:sugar phosphate isomerase/epimerase [bacterium]RQV97814.1 MAG: sugar phosphate isomerase/epimerase [bacterium]
MKKQSETKKGFTRREFLGGTMAAAALSMMPKSVMGAPAFIQTTDKPDSNFNGVQIGVITYSYRSMPNQSAEDILGYLVEDGLSSVELMSGPAEQFAGVPTFEPMQFTRGVEITDEMRAEMQVARQRQAEETLKWRLSVSMDKYAALRKLYNDAGVDIYIVKFDNIGPGMSEEEVDYCFNVAKALGARGITTEISNEKAEFLGPYTDKHNIKIGFHNHTQVNPDSWTVPFSYGKNLTMNFDIGHYVAGTNLSPIPIIEKYAAEDRILSLHIKDRRVNNGANMPFGQGDTPLGLVLKLMKRNQYTFPAHIELEYNIPEGSDAVAEVKNCVAYCKEVLA